MPVFTHIDFDHHEQVVFGHDPASGLKAVIAIHNTRFGSALGGCRYLPYADEQSAIADAIRLAQGMSYKAALAGIDHGGGKAVIIRPPHVQSRAALFEAFGLGKSMQQLEIMRLAAAIISRPSSSPPSAS